MPGAARSSGKPIAKRSASCVARCICRPYLAEAHLLLGRIHLRTGRTADAIQAFKIALWSEETAAGHVALAEAYLQSQNVDAAKEEVDARARARPGIVSRRGRYGRNSGRDSGQRCLAPLRRAKAC